MEAAIGIGLLIAFILLAGLMIVRDRSRPTTLRLIRRLNRGKATGGVHERQMPTL
ncbi:hypothetical protein [Candidatus Nitrospira bockiana]